MTIQKSKSDVITERIPMKKKKVRWKKFYRFSLISHKGPLWMNRDLNDLFDRQSVRFEADLE